MTQTNLVLCQKGRELYLAWVQVCNNYTTDQAFLVQAAAHEYVEHRKTCKECSQFLNKFNYDDKND